MKTTISFTLNHKLIAEVLNKYNISIEALSYLSKIELVRLIKILQGNTDISVYEVMVLADMLRIPIASLMLLK